MAKLLISILITAWLGLLCYVHSNYEDPTLEKNCCIEGECAAKYSEIVKCLSIKVNKLEAEVDSLKHLK